jgi:hypothetical protein
VAAPPPKLNPVGVCVPSWLAARDTRQEEEDAQLLAASREEDARVAAAREAAAREAAARGQAWEHDQER